MVALNLILSKGDHGNTKIEYNTEKVPDSKYIVPVMIPTIATPGCYSFNRWCFLYGSTLNQILSSVIDVLGNINSASDNVYMTWDQQNLEDALLCYMYRTSSSSHKKFHFLK